MDESSKISSKWDSLHEGLEPTGCYNMDGTPLFEIKSGWKLRGLTFGVSRYLSNEGDWKEYVLPITVEIVKEV